MKKAKLIFNWILRILVSLGFLLASLGKLSNNPKVLDMFEDWGYPNGFHFIIGIFELVLAVLVLIPKTLKIAIISLTIIMFGAIITHIINDPILQVIRPLIFLIFLFIIYYINYYKKEL